MMTRPELLPKTCIIGAGAAGLAAARALKAKGLPYDQFEAEPDVGGNWAFGVYDYAYLISSRKTSGFTEFPMPEDYPDFPSRLQMRAYIHAYADHFDLRRHISFSEKVASVTRVKGQIHSGWRVKTENGLEAVYDSVVIANGHLWDRSIPTPPGSFAGKQVHSRDYRNVSDIEGNRVLVVGAGNSGCDLVAESAFAGKQVTLSLRRGYWFLPKTLFGAPRAELFIEKLPRPLKKLVLSALSYVVLGRIDRRGLPRPDHGLFAEPPIINSLLFYLLEHGRVAIASEIERFEGNDIVFKDGRRGTFDTILWATGYKTSFPFLEDGHLDWARGVPLRFAGGVMPPRAPGLYFNGLASPRGGNLPMHSAGGELIAECVATQRVMGDRFHEEIRRQGEAVPLMDGLVSDIVEDMGRFEGMVSNLRHRQPSVQDSETSALRA